MVEYSQLRYECNCIHSNDEVAQYRGVCKNCVYEKKNVNIPENHHVQKIHDTTAEFEIFNEKLKYATRYTITRNEFGDQECKYIVCYDENGDKFCLNDIICLGEPWYPLTARGQQLRLEYNGKYEKQRYLEEKYGREEFIICPKKNCTCCE